MLLFCSGVPLAWDCYQSSERLHGITMVESTSEQWTVPFMVICVKWWVKKPTIYFLLFRTCTYYKLLLMIQITKSNYLIVLLSLFYILQIFQYNIRSYPTTIFYNQSVPHQYHGHHDSYHILEFIQVNIYCTSWFLCRCKFLHFNLK